VCRFRRRAAEGELTDRAFDVKRDAGHAREQVDVDAADRAAAGPTLESYFFSSGRCASKASSKPCR